MMIINILIVIIYVLFMYCFDNVYMSKLIISVQDIRFIDFIIIINIIAIILIMIIILIIIIQ